MNRGCRVDVMNGQVSLIFIGDLGRDFFGDDLGENGFFHRMLLIVPAYYHGGMKDV